MVIEFFVEYLDDDFLFRAVDNGEENFDSFVDESIFLLQKKKKNCAHIFTEISNPVDCQKKRRDELLDRCVRHLRCNKDATIRRNVSITHVQNERPCTNPSDQNCFS
jgi:hypothetical protein